MKTTLAAIAVAASLFGGTVRAQDMALANQTIEVGLSMLELAAGTALQKYGFGDQNVMDLTLSQLATIKSITSSNEYSDSERKQQIGVILAD